MITWIKPLPAESSTYFRKYIDLVPEGDLIHYLSTQGDETILFLKKLPDEKLDYRYADEKWTIPEILQHMIDAERIFSYRALCIARKDKTSLPGFEENDYANEANKLKRNMQELLEEFHAVRTSTLYLIKSFTQDHLKITGTASNAHISVNALCYIIAGHIIHHTNIIHERYL